MSNCEKHPDVAASAYCRTCGKALCSSCTRDVRGVVYCEECLAARMEGAPSVGPVPPGQTIPPPGLPPQAPGTGSPGLAAILGFIPGVGAMYNGQFMKGFLHLVVFATLIWLTDNATGLFGMGVAAWLFYMVFDAYQTAKAIKYGLPLPDPLGINNFVGGPHREAQYAQRMNAAGERIGEGFSHAATAFRAGAAGDAANPGAPPPTGQPFVDPAAQPYVAPPPVDPPPPRQATPTGAVVLIGLGLLFLLGNMGMIHGLHNWWPLALIGIGLWLVYQRQQKG